MKKELSIEEIQKVSFEILKKVVSLCNDLGLRYYIFYGSLIGIIRHKGFIPWDDDLDIVMPREDYEILINYFITHNNLLENLELFEPRVNENYPYMIARISDNRYILDTKNEINYGLGIFIDIYPLDGLGNTIKDAISLGKKGDHLSSMCYQSTRTKFEIGTTKSTFRKIIKFPVFLLSKIIGKTYYQSKLQKLSNINAYNSSKYVGCVVWLSGGKKDIFKREWFNESLQLPFDDTNVCIPKEYEIILKQIYGDYMKLPPISERFGHHNYRAYLK